MKILDAVRVGDWFPLGDQFCDDCFVGGMSFGEVRGLHFPEDATVVSNAWVCAEDWDRVEEGVVLVTEDGDELGWRGVRGEETLVAGARSVLILFPWHLLFVNEQVVGLLDEDFIEGEVSGAAHVDGKIKVGKGSRILPGVVIEGNVVIGENCKVGPNCYLRGNTSIGDGVHIGQAVEVKNSIVGDGSSVGHLSYVGDSVIGAKVNFGAGTITSNLRHDGLNHRSAVGGELVGTGRRKFGAIVGDGVHTGILTAIWPGRKLGAGTSTRPNGEVERDLR